MRSPFSHRAAIDPVIAVVLAGFILADLALAAADSGGFDVPKAAVALAGAASLAVLHRYPRVVLVVTVVAVLTFSILSTEAGITEAVPVLVAIFANAYLGHRWYTIGVVSPVLVGVVAGTLTKGGDDPLRALITAAFLPIGWFVAAFVFGELFRQHGAYIEQANARAEAAERTREETALRRAGEERLRIARELHDSLTHAISVIKMQSGVAVHLASKRGEEPSEALVAIQQASAEANRELRSTLHVLRDNDNDDPHVLDDIPALIERSRAAGVDAELVCVGRKRSLPTEVEAAAYRVVQESLTNVARHSAADSATVRLSYADGELAISVSDNGSPDAAAPVPGMGLLGMRERVTELGGRLTAEPGPGGFVVSATIPLTAGVTA